MNETDALALKWRDLWASLAVNVPQASFGQLVSLYTEPHRHYHNLAHILDCLCAFDTVAQMATEPQAIRVALWFHDAVYDPRASDNETRSADLARQTLIQSQAPQELLPTVQRLIMATRHDAPPGDTDEALMMDVDLAILAADAERFDAYEQAIRREYAHVPEAGFRAGRAGILRRFLNRPSVYHTPSFRKRYERAARSNLTRSIATLERVS